MILFLSGMIFGTFVMFLARIADKNINKIVTEYEKNGATFRRPEPISIPPPDDDMLAMNEALQEQLKKDYGD